MHFSAATVFATVLFLGVLVPSEARSEVPTPPDVEAIRAECDAGKPEGCAELGNLYMLGFGVPLDFAQGNPLAQRACEASNARGCHLVALSYQYGDGIPRDLAKAAVFYERGCAGGDLFSCRGLAVAFVYGWGVEKDQPKGIALLESSCEKNDPSACEHLASFSETGFGVAKDAERAKELAKRAAELYGKECAAAKGGVNARYSCARLAAYYDAGAGGLPLDPDEAFRLYRKACLAGSPDMCSNLGTRYEQGRGTPRDFFRAAELYRYACERNVSSACFDLARLQREGRGMERDIRKAASLFQEVCRKGNGEACALSEILQLALAFPAPAPPGPSIPVPLREISLESEYDYPQVVRFSSDGKHVAAGSLMGRLGVWGAADGKPLWLVKETEELKIGSVKALSFSPDGRLLASGHSRARPKLWDGKTGKLLHEFEDIGESTVAVDFSPDGKWLLTASYSGKLLVWDVKTKQKLWDRSPPVGNIWDARFVDKGKSIALVLSTPDESRLIDTKSGRFLAALPALERGGRTLAVSADGSRIAVAGWGDTLRITDSKTGKEAASVSIKPLTIPSLSFSPDGRYLATGQSNSYGDNRDVRARVWDLKTGITVLYLPGHKIGKATSGPWAEVFSVDFSSKGGLLATTASDGKVRLWDVKSLAGAAKQAASCRAGNVQDCDGDLFLDLLCSRKIEASCAPKTDAIAAFLNMACEAGISHLCGPAQEASEAYKKLQEWHKDVNERNEKEKKTDPENKCSAKDMKDCSAIGLFDLGCQIGQQHYCESRDRVIAQEEERRHQPKQDEAVKVACEKIEPPAEKEACDALAKDIGGWSVLGAKWHYRDLLKKDSGLRGHVTVTGSLKASGEVSGVSIGESDFGQYPQLEEHVKEAVSEKKQLSKTPRADTQVALRFDFLVESQLPPEASEPLSKDAACKTGPECFLLAKKFQTGKGAVENPVLAVTLFDKACGLGDGAACLEAANSHVAGRGVKPDAAAMAGYFKKACDNGSGEGCYTAAALYLTGTQLPQDSSAASRLYAQGCKMGHGKSCAGIAAIYAAGIGVSQDSKRSAHFFQQGCDLSDAVSCRSLAALLAIGGKESDRAKIEESLRQSCGLGDAEGCANLGVHLRSASTDPEQLRIATLSFKKACEKESPLGCAELGRAYLNGSGVSKDLRESREIFAAACEKHGDQSCALLGSLYYQGEGVEKDRAKAAELFGRACDGKDADGCFLSAQTALTGDGIARDVGLAEQRVRKGLEIRPEDAGGWETLGEILQEKNKAGEASAQEAFSKACSLGQAEACKRAGK
ncbi:MAG: hypothetical protein AB1405_12735 [Bdellovibrionota bacterium]